MGVSDGKGAENLFGEIKPQNFHSLMKGINLQIQEIQ